jgi:NADH dehydrogenase [ubiquinone] 1 alpha subcomplex assembly factor 7
MTDADLLNRLKRRITHSGPITVAEYMAEVLTHPSQGYYSTRDPFGAAGDFVTAPEISQMFGELTGLWCAEAWQRLGMPDPVVLAELGPGRGTLMSDALRAAGMLPGFRDALQVHLVEVSPPLRARQRDTLRDVDVIWHAEVAELPETPVLAIANEFFDALPIRQFEKTPRGWCERMVGYDPDADRLAFALAAPGPQAEAYVPEALRGAETGAVVEVSPAAISVMHELARRVATHGGAVLAVDYGRAAPAAEPTLQAVQRHRRADVLDTPGEADLTAHVDFPTLARAAREAGAEVHGPVGQGEFLLGLGLRQRADILKANATPRQRNDIDEAVKRLTAPEQMGRLFKALAVVPPGFGVPAGFPQEDA